MARKSRLMKRVLFLAMMGLVLGLAAMSTGIASAQTAQTPEKSTINPKIDSALAEVLQLAGGGVSAQSIQVEARQNGIPVQGNAVKVVLETSSPASFLVALVGALSGGTVTGQSRNYIELLVPLNNSPLNALLQIANVTGISYIRAPMSPQALVTSEGVSLTGANTFQGNGFTGAGTKIAVIDLGFSGTSLAQSQGELPINVQRFDFSGTGLESSTSHGTAVAEIVHDMAPGAQLYLMKIADEVDLENAVDEAIRQGVDIINHSVGWFNTSFYDGTGPIVSNVTRARSAGILWINAAGNYAQRHWQGVAFDNNSNGWAEFQGQEGLTFTAQAGQTINVFMTWRDWPSSAQDYDLFVTNAGGTVFASSERLQSGTQPPTESIFFTAPTSGTYQIRVKPLSVSSPKELAIFNLNQDITPVVTSGSIVSPADSSSALAVGSVGHSQWTTGPIQVFSSQGPTTDGRTKPDIVGPDNVRVSTSQFNPFSGTSAAAPHVAGAAALLLSESPSLNVSSLESKLRGDAIPMGSPTQFGSGRLNLTSQPTARPDLTIFDPSFTPANPTIGQNVTITATIRNQGQANSGPFLVQLSDQFGNNSQQLTSIGPSGTTTVTFNRQLFTSSQVVTLTVDPQNQVTETDESNNQTQITISSQQVQRPDLVVQSIQYSPTNPQVGSLLTYDVTIRNQGNASAGFFFMELADSQGQDRRGVSGLAAGATARVTIQRSLALNQETVFASIDVFNQVTESNENNNVSSITVTATTQTPQGIDVRTDRTNYQLNDSIDVDFTLDASGYVRILVVNSAGTVQQLYPQSGSGFLNAGNYDLGQLLNSNLQVSSPTGAKYIHAVSTSSQVNFNLHNQTNSSWTNTSTFQSQLVNRIQLAGSGIGYDLDVATINVGAAPQPLSIDISTDRSSYNTGESIQATFTLSGSSAFVRIFEVDNTGTVTRIYPVDANADGFLTVGTYNLSQLIGSSFTATGPAGQKNLHIAAADERPAYGIGNETVSSWSNPSVFQNELVHRIQTSVPNSDFDLDFAAYTIAGGGPSNQPPVANFTVNPSNPMTNTTVTLNGSGSFDPDGFIVSYNWTVTGTSTINGTGAQFQVNFSTARDYTITLTVTDNQGATASSTQVITVTGPQPQPLSIDVNTNQTSYNIGQNAQVTFTINNPGYVKIFDVDPNGAAIQLYPQNGNGFLNAGTYNVGQLINANLTISGPAGTEHIHGVITSQQVSYGVHGQTNAAWTTPGTFQGRLTQSILATNPNMQSGFDVQSFTVVGNTPQPQDPADRGIYIRSQGSSQMIVTVQGDENWTEDHPFTIRMRMSDTNNNVFGFISRNIQVEGNADDNSPSFDNRNLVLRGTVQDGRIIYTISIRNPAAVWFDAEFDLDTTDSEVEEGAHEIPMFATINNSDIRIEPREEVTGEFALLGNSGQLLPLVRSNTSICSSGARLCKSL